MKLFKYPQTKPNWKYILIVVILAIIVSGVLGWQFYLKEEVVIPEREGKEIGKGEEIDISNWKTFKNERYGYEIKYPAESSGARSQNYFLSANQSDDVSLGASFKKDNYSYWLSINIFVAENKGKEGLFKWLSRKNFAHELSEDRLPELTDGPVYIKEWKKDSVNYKKIYFTKEGGDYIYAVKLSIGAHGETSVLQALSEIRDKMLSTLKVDAMSLDSEIVRSEDGVDWYNYQKQIEEQLVIGLGFTGTTYIRLFRLGVIKSGKYQGGELLFVTMLPDYTGKGPRSGKPRIHRFIVYNDTAILLPKISGQGEAEYINELAEDAFGQIGLNYEIDNEFTIPRLEYLNTINGEKSRQVVYYDTEEFGVLDEEKLVKVFHHSQYGDVYTTRIAFSSAKSFYYSSGPGDPEAPESFEGCRGDSCFHTNGFFVFRPDGTFLRYYYDPNFSQEDIVWNEPMSTTQAYDYQTYIGCSGNHVDYASIAPPSLISSEDLVRTGYFSSTDDPIYSLKDDNHKFYTEFYKNYKANFTDWHYYGPKTVEFEGIGMGTDIKDGILTVITVFEGTPAEKAGIVAGDKIIKIDNITTAELSIEEATQLIKGEKGTKVVLTILGESEDEPREIEVVRDIISASLSAEMQPIFSYKDFLDTRPVFFWHDPFGRLVRFQNKDFLPPWFCEPIIYLYPQTEQRIQVLIKPKGGISDSAPAYQNGWDVIADPDGRISDLSLRKSYPYLFWEGWSLIFPQPEKGFVIEKSEIHRFFLDILPKLGLSGKERDDFMEAWEPKFKDAPYYFITFHDKEFIDFLAPLKVLPQPDTVIRILMDYRPLDRSIQVESIEIETPERKGFTVVEWGGLVR